ncbi:MAG TPA: hypothetical protein VIO64_06010 [Pseudobacteroides sp.]|uniref:hypothetical protein n=1 Tax=Pseudobacteroides sp. TaxID=1968840 RepID=UPI002F924177
MGTYEELYKQVIRRIDDLESGSEFYLRDIITMPPALLGTWLSVDVESGKIPDVERLGFVVSAQKYRKK